MGKKKTIQAKVRQSRCDANSKKGHIRKVKDGMIAHGIITARCYGCNRKQPELVTV